MQTPILMIFGDFAGNQSSEQGSAKRGFAKLSLVPKAQPKGRESRVYKLEFGRFHEALSENFLIRCGKKNLARDLKDAQPLRDRGNCTAERGRDVRFVQHLTTPRSQKHQ